MKKILPFLLLLVMSQVLLGQMNKCGHQHLLEKRGPQFQKSSEKMYEEALRQTKNSQSRSRQLLTVPVVVHILYETPEQNISDEKVQSQIAVLNEDFQRLNEDAGEARTMFQEVAGNPEIQFVLADTDPDGNTTTGITRTPTLVKSFLPLNLSLNEIFDAADSCGVNVNILDEFLDGFHCINNTALEYAFEKLESQDTTQFEDMKFSGKGGKDAWDQDRYINIWVCNMTGITDNQPSISLLGYATPPAEAPNWEGLEVEFNDGIVVHYQAFGRNTPSVGALGVGGGRTCTHEMGHYLGLRHTFGDGDCEMDDGLIDTPTMDAFPRPKSLEEVSIIPSCLKAKETDTCPDDELPDMVENYMGYSPQACQNMFTIEQVAIMRAMLEGPRSGLIIEQQITNTYDPILDQAIRLYPNPTNGQVHIDMQDIDPQDFTIHVENIMGQQIFSQAVSSILDLSKLEKGIYLVRFKSTSANIVKKIILE